MFTKSIFKTRLLFFAHSITLAHRMRPEVLLKNTDRKFYELGLATNDQFNDLFEKQSDCSYYSISTPSLAEFQDRLWKSRPIFNETELDTYISEDLKIIEDFKPDFIIGDFRLSLAISSNLAGIPYGNITNIYWDEVYSPYWESPDSILTHLFNPYIINLSFKKFKSFFSRPHLEGFKKACSKNKVTLPETQSLNDFYHQGDYLFLADIISTAPQTLITKKHIPIGPIVWSPQMELPSWWSDLLMQKKGHKILYLNLGSSGNKKILPRLIKTLATLNVILVIGGIETNLKNKYSAKYLPGLEVCQIADIVICNGGSPSTQQALSCGVPIIGICNNLDQILNMKLLEASGVGYSFRSDNINYSMFLEKIIEVLNNAKFATKAKAIKNEISNFNSIKNWNLVLNEITQKQRKQFKI